MRGKGRIWPVAILGLAAVVAAGLVVASLPGGHKEIEAVGVLSRISSSSSANGVIDTYAFDDGRTYSMPRQLDSVRSFHNFPEVGDLLIAGSKPHYWMLLAVPLDPPSDVCAKGSFGIPDLSGYDTQTTVELDFGVTLQKSPEFNPRGPLRGRHFRPQSLVCFDRQGQVLQIDG